MAIKKIENILEKIVIVLIYLAVSSPLWVTNLFYYPGIFTKTIILFFFVQAALACYFILLKINPAKYCPAGNYLIYFLAGFYILMFASFLWAVNPEKSFWGNFERLNGAFTQLHYFCLFILLAAMLKTKRQWRRLLRFNLLIAYVICLYALAQELKLPFVYETGAGRVTSSIGNPLFLASYLIIQFFINLKLILELWREQAAKALIIFYSIGLVLISHIIIAAGVRGVFLGLVIGLFLFLAGLFFILKKQSSSRRYIGLAFLFFALMAAAIFFLRERDFIKESPIINRLTNYSLENATIQTRLRAWKGGLAAIKEHPLLGVGWENYYVVFSRHFDPIFYNLTWQETYWDRAHNNYINIANELGILGLILYLLIFAAAVFYLWKLLIRADDWREKAGYLSLMVLIIAYLSQNFFGFDALASYVALFLFLAYVSFEKSSADAAAGRTVNETIGTNKKNIYITALIFLAVLSAVFYKIDYQFYIKSNLAVKGVLDVSADYYYDLAGGAEQYQLALDRVKIDKKEILMRLGLYTANFIAKPIESSVLLNNTFKYVFEQMEEEIGNARQDVHFMVTLANIYNACLEYNIERDAKLARECYQRAREILLQSIELSPNRQQAYLSMGNSYLINKEYDQAISYFTDALRYNDRFPDLYWFISLAYFTKGDADNGISYAEQAIDLNYQFRTEQEVNYLAKAYAERGDYDSLLKLYLKLTDKFSESGGAFAKLAAVYMQLGDKAGAERAVQRAVALDPSLAEEAKIFLNILQSDN